MSFVNNKANATSKYLTNIETNEYREFLKKSVELQTFIKKNTGYNARVSPAQLDDSGFRDFNVELSADGIYWVCLDGVPAEYMPDSFYRIMERLISTANLKSYRINEYGQLVEKIIHDNSMDQDYFFVSRGELYQISRGSRVDIAEFVCPLDDVTGIEVDSDDYDNLSRLIIKSRSQIVKITATPNCNYKIEYVSQLCNN